MLCMAVPSEIIRVSHEYMYAVFGILFVFAFRLEDELLEDVVISCNNTVRE